MSFRGIVFYVAADGRWQNVPPPDQLEWDTSDLARRFHQSLLGDQQSFGGGLLLPYHTPVEFEWVGVGQTCGMAVWQRQRTVWAASVMLNGLEGPGDLTGLQRVLATRSLLPPEPLWLTVLQEPRPLLTTLHYDIRRVGDAVVATAAPVLATAFFSMFGTSG